MADSNTIERSEVNARWRSAIFEIRRWNAKETKNRKISPDKALWLIESIRIYEFNHGERATIDGLSSQMGESYTNLSAKIAVMEKINIIKRVSYDGKLRFDPHPELPKLIVRPISGRNREELEADALAVVHSIISSSLEVGDSAENTHREKIDFTQQKTDATTLSMQEFIIRQQVMRDVICERLDPEVPKRLFSATLQYLLTVLTTCGPNNQWVTLQDLANAHGATVPWASRVIKDLTKMSLVELSKSQSSRMRTFVKEGVEGQRRTYSNVKQVRVSPWFLEETERRYQSAREVWQSSQDSPVQPKPSSAASSNVQSMSDSPLP